MGFVAPRGKWYFFALEWNFHRLIYVHLLQNCGKIHWIQSTFKKERGKNLCFWIQSTFPSYQIITCPVCLDTLCNWTTKTSYRFQTSRDWYHFSTFCTDKCLDLIWICNLYIVCNNFSYQITSLLCLDGLCKWSSKTSYRFQTSKDWYYFSPFQKSWICNLSFVVSSFIRPTARPNSFIN